MLVIKDLTKTFKNAKKSTLCNVSLKVKKGEIFGLIGRNGAGKTTVIKCITGILPFESGEILIKKFDIKKDEIKAKSQIGYVPDNHDVYENLTGNEYLNFMADVYGIDKNQREESINYYANIFNMTEALNTQINAYSHGMRQKICIMGALVHNPSLWILDEPFLGLDTQSIKIFKKCIFNYTKDKKHTVIFSSHNLESVKEICDRVCVIEKGVVKGNINMKTKTANKRLLKLLGD